MTAVARVARPSPIPPLFQWQDRAEAARLDSIRTDLKARIGRLPRFSHRRLVLEARLADLTARQLAIETSRTDPA